MNLFNMINQFQQNPLAMIQQRYNVPQGMNTPDEILKHLVDSGQVSQQQINNIMNMRNNPMMKTIFGK